ncbi:MAG: hypothetical protein L0Z62_00015 [Gemmataceae bacterium]|nr:hypothetical protein [Gemmataceae bacterium]
MATATPATPPSAPASPEIYEATRATDGSEAVDRGKKLTRAEAEKRRRAGLDIVVCGPDEGANWQLARESEKAVSPAGQKPKAHGPHLGPASLPHWQQGGGSPPGHSFYETQGTPDIPPRKARVSS